MSAGFAHVQRFLRETSGITVDDDRRFFLEDRLKPVLSAAKIAGLDDLACRLHANRHSDLARTVVETMTNNETSFFRDRAFFKALSDHLLPQLFTARETTRRLRIWCAGCSTGQEPYSVAMILDDALRAHPGWRVEILATDLSRTAIERAREGLYSQFEIQRGVSVTRLLQHFRQRGEVWQVKDELRSKVTFEVQNLVSISRTIGQFDIVLCRNVLLHFDAGTRRLVLDRLSDTLADDGYLALGGAERIGDLCPALQAVSTIPFTFIRREMALSTT